MFNIDLDIEIGNILLWYCVTKEESYGTKIEMHLSIDAKEFALQFPSFDVYVIVGWVQHLNSQELFKHVI